MEVLYNVDSLVDYFLATGDFSEPETRLEFSDRDLKALDQAVRGRSHDQYHHHHHQPTSLVISLIAERSL
jgi:hypothetical protein